MGDEEEAAVLFFAGACRGSAPGPGAAGFVLRRGDVEVGSGHAFVDEETTKSVAEFNGLLLGLSAALDAGVRRLEARGDSEVVVYTTRGALRIRQHHLMPHCRRAQHLARRFESFAIERVSAAANASAVAEATLGLGRELRAINVVVARGGYDPLPWTDRGRGRPARWKSDSVEMVNPYTGARRALPSMPAFKNPDCPDYDEDFGDVDVGAATLRDRVYFIGGECVSRTYPGGVRSLDLRTGRWHRHASLPDNGEMVASTPSSGRRRGPPQGFCKRTGCAVVSSGGHIYQIGGKFVDETCGDAHACHDTDVYDPRKDEWRSGPRTAAPRMHASAVACDGLIFVVGGTGSVVVELDGFEHYGPNQQRAVDSVECLDASRPLAWLAVAPLPEKLAGVVLLAYDGAVYALGGQAIVYESPAKGAKCHTKYTRGVYVLDVSRGPQGAAWTQLRHLPVATAYAAVFDLGSGLFCLASSGHADLLVDVRRSHARGGHPRCEVLREGWPCDTHYAALFDRRASGVCLGAERSSRAALALVDTNTLSGSSRFVT